MYCIYTDGACSGNGIADSAIGGWAFVIISPGNEVTIEASGGEIGTTNNRMEMTAVTESLNYLKQYITKNKQQPKQNGAK